MREKKFAKLCPTRNAGHRTVMIRLMYSLGFAFLAFQASATASVSLLSGSLKKMRKANTQIIVRMHGTRNKTWKLITFGVTEVSVHNRWTQPLK